MNVGWTLWVRFWFIFTKIVLSALREPIGCYEILVDLLVCDVSRLAAAEYTVALRRLLFDERAIQYVTVI